MTVVAAPAGSRTIGVVGTTTGSTVTVRRGSRISLKVSGIVGLFSVTLADAGTATGSAYEYVVVPTVGAEGTIHAVSSAPTGKARSADFIITFTGKNRITALR